MNKGLWDWALLAVVPLALAVTGNAAADDIKGKVKAVSAKGGQISVTVENKGVMLFRVTDGTVFSNADSIKEIHTDDLLQIDYRVEGFDNVAKAVSRVVAKLPEGVTEIETAEVESLVKTGPEAGKYLLVDSRPAGKYNESHIPTAVSIPFAELEKNPALLSAPKDRTLVFYCAGVT